MKSVNGDVSLVNGEILPNDIKDRYKTAFDHDQFKLIDSAAAKQKWIDMGQSLNLFNNKSSLKFLNDLYIHARNSGLKSTYYLRNKSASEIEKSTKIEKVDDTNSNNPDTSNDNLSDVKACSILDPTCESCQ